MIENHKDPLLEIGTEPAQSVREVEQLLDLAEKVNSQIGIFEQRLSRIKVQLFACLIIGYPLFAGILTTYRDWQIYDYLKTPLIISAAIAGIATVFYIFNRIQIRNSIRQELKIELRVSGELIQMLSSLVESLPNSIGAVDRAIFIIRLKRLKFSDQRVDSRDFIDVIQEFIGRVFFLNRK